MEKIQETPRTEDSSRTQRLYIAFELSNSEWKLAFSDGSKLRYVSIEAGDLEALGVELEKAKWRFGLESEAQVASCYEAGRDGFWLHRYLERCGIANLVVDSASIEVNRRKRRTKTDRIDARKLLGMLIRYHGGEKRVFAVLRVPTVEDEQPRHLNRELEVLGRERSMHKNRIRALLIQQGIKVANPARRDFLRILDSVRSWGNQELSADLKARIQRQYERLRLVDRQVLGLKRERLSRRWL